MQLNTLVLPAPLGPIRANSSPASTASDTPSSTRRPPKLSDSGSISSSAIPPTATAVLLDLAVAARAAPPCLPQIELLDVGVIAEPRGVTVEHDAAVLQHVAEVGDGERGRRALLDQQDRDAKLAPD